MLSKSVYLITSNFKLVYKVEKAIGNLVKVVHNLKPSNGHPNIPFIVTTPLERKDIPHKNVIAIHPNEDLITIRSIIIKKLQTNGQTTITIGIDPGHNIGIAVMNNNKIIVTGVVYTVDKLIKWIRSNLSKIQYSTFLIKIGNGDPVRRDKIIDRLIKEFDKKIIIVDERNTSIRLSQDRTRHEEAAILISKRIGKQINDIGSGSKYDSF